MHAHITDVPDPDDRPEVDEEIRDSLEVEPFPDDLIQALVDIGGVYRPGFMRKRQA